MHHRHTGRFDEILFHFCFKRKQNKFMFELAFAFETLFLVAKTLVTFVKSGWPQSTNTRSIIHHRHTGRFYEILFHFCFKRKQNKVLFELAFETLLLVAKTLVTFLKSGWLQSTNTRSIMHHRHTGRFDEILFHFYFKRRQNKLLFELAFAFETLFLVAKYCASNTDYGEKSPPTQLIMIMTKANM